MSLFSVRGFAMKMIKVKVLKESQVNEMCGDEHSMHQPMMGPVIGIHPDDEPCGCPDMAHNHNNDEGSMARSQLMHMKNYAEQLMQIISDHDDLPEWVQNKIAVMTSNIGKIKHYLEYKIARDHS